MATDDHADVAELLAALRSDDWSSTVDAIGRAGKAMRGAIASDPRIAPIVAELAIRAGHPKWEVRRAVAIAATHIAHPDFDAVLARLELDDNSRVRQAAQQAALRRRDSRHASTLGRQHEDRINSVLDDIAARFGPKGRDAVRRAAEQVANTFARELYHEIVKLVSPLAFSADKLRTQLSDGSVSAETLAEEAARMGRRISHLRAILDAMRAYTAQPALSYSTEIMCDVLHEAASLAIENSGRLSQRPEIEITVPPALVACVARTRFAQALTNILLNAIEAYADMESMKPIRVAAQLREGLVTIDVEDFGCGMSAESQQDALTLFSTSKEHGTGFGLPLAAKIIESEHGGRLSIKSAKGRGTTVRITIPLNPQASSG